MNIVLVNENAEELVTVTDVKTHLRIGEDIEDELLEIYIGSARELCEADTNRSLKLKEYMLYLKEWYGKIILPYPPICQIKAITYIDEYGIEQTLPRGYYLINRNGDLILSDIVLETRLNSEVEDAICIHYEAGYKSTDIIAEPNKELVLPVAIKQAILLLVGYFYENRENVSQVNQVELPISAKHLIRKYKVFRL